MIINVKDLKNKMARINLAVEKNRINPKAGWIEIETINDKIVFKVSNNDYFLKTSIDVGQVNDEDYIHATVLAETFIPLVAKLENETISIVERLNTLILETETNKYTFPVIKELGKVKTVDRVKFNKTKEPIEIDCETLLSISNVNAKGLADTLFSKDIQQYIYVDNEGAITFTENIYVNNFEQQFDTTFKMLLTGTQARILEVFKNELNIKMEYEQQPTFDVVSTTTNKIKLYNDNVELILMTQPQYRVDRWPSLKIRALSENTNNIHAVVDRRELQKALTRLMVFDKKFDITVMDYSKIEFKENELHLISIKNNNMEKIPYLKATNTKEHTSIIRFADLINQIKVVTDKEIDISYGDKPSIVLNSTFKQILPEIQVRHGK